MSAISGCIHDFSGLKFSQDKVCTLNSWRGKLIYLTVTCLLNNNCNKKLFNRTTIVNIIFESWAVYFVQHSVVYLQTLGLKLTLVVIQTCIKKLSCFLTSWWSIIALCMQENNSGECTEELQNLHLYRSTLDLQITR